MTGHLPSGYSDPRAGAARDGAGAGQLPTLAEVVDEAKLLLTRAIDSLGRQWDPASAPAEDAYRRCVSWAC